MGQPAVVLNDRINGSCLLHQIPSPTGAPMPSPAPLPFSAPLTLGLATRVTIGGRPMAVVGSSGYNTPPHVGLHASDPFLVPNLQEGRVLSGSATVLVEGKPAAYSSCPVAQCGGVPAQLVGSAVQVQIGP
jgi:uncharacterized Zn-binding protein involved in type VI secretion